MNYINSEERRSKKRQFIVWYSVSICLIIIIASAFIVPKSTENQTKTLAVQPVIEKDLNDTSVQNLLDSAMRDVQLLQEKLKQRDSSITQLKEQLAVKGSNNGTAKDDKSEKEVKFLKWALSSQSAEVVNLKKENNKLKAQIKDLRKFIQ